MLQNTFNKFKEKPFKFSNGFFRLLVLSLIVIAACVRIWLYGDPNLSIAGNDTISYVESSQVPLFSSEMMTGRRLLSTNLIYKMLEPKDGYQILVNGSLETTRREFQPGFNRVVILQLILSILGWGFLAFTVSENLKAPIMKVLSAVTILLFAFTPQMADWDSILMSESLTFSLFALLFALMVKIVFTSHKDPNANIYPYLAVWAVTFFFWTFLRDTNLFASLVTIGMIALLLLSAVYRKSRYLYGILTFLTMIFIIGLFTSGNSTRSLVQIINIYHDDLLPSPAAVATLTELGMPDPSSAEYPAWFQENATKTFVKFILIHPGYAVTKIIRDFPGAFTEIKQTYFNAREHTQVRNFLMNMGDALHPENTTPFLLDIFLLLGLILSAIKYANGVSRPWAWLGAWLFLTASLTFIPSILGDTWALNRHALFSTMIYRLFMWLFVIILTDIALEKPSQPQIM